MANPYSEALLVEEPACRLFQELGWQAASGEEETLGPNGTLGRETRDEVVLVPRLRAVLVRLNPDLPSEAIEAAVEELKRDRSTQSLEAANQAVYDLLKQGVEVSFRTDKGQRIERVRVLDWEHPEENDFLVVRQLTVLGSLYTCRPDLVGFVNGLPLIVIEFKKPGVSARQAFEENLTSYKHPQNGVPALFWYNALLIASNGAESRVGSLTSDWERFFEWKRVEKEEEPRRVSLEVVLRGTCDRTRFLDLLENFTVFSQLGAGTAKILAQNHQFLGVNRAIVSTLAARNAGHGRAGVFWQTQGSGKSFSMVFFAQKILRKLTGNWTFVVVTDRVELDSQIAKTFKGVGAVSEAESKECHAASGAHLRELLRGNHRYVFTLIQKFQIPEPLSDRRDIIVITDEAHRSQYDVLAMNMRASLPNALFIAFTGTPLIAGEERTREVFGDYVSIYDFQQSVEDGATVPLFYENRTPELKLENPQINEDIYAVIEDAGLDEEQEKRLERDLGRMYHLLTRDDRLETVAKDVVRHFLGRGFLGKAMVVSIDKATALRMHDKVLKHWEEERKRVARELDSLTIPARTPDEDRKKELLRRRDILDTTDMAVIVSPGQNEIEQMKVLGLDILPHRERMGKERLDEKFKEPEDPLRIVFVCAMWLTGFDAPSCSTIYLDKPMRNHTLMQTIARANRIFPGKHSGLIVDYANVFASLERALAIYGKGTGGETPVRDKAGLIEDLRQSLAEAEAFCALHGVSISAIEASSDMQRLDLVTQAVERLISPDPLRKDFLAHERLVRALFEAAKPDPATFEFFSRVACLGSLAGEIRSKTGEGTAATISHIFTEINRILDESISADSYVIEDSTRRRPAIDLTKIDFEKLAKEFKQSRTKSIEIEQLKTALRAQLDRMILLNRTRTNYLEKFESLIETYNTGSRNIEELFRELMALSRELSEEQQRHVRDHLSEAELAVFDLLTRPGPDLTSEEREEVKKLAKGMLGRLKELLNPNWRQTAQARAKVRLAIEDTLDEGLPRVYTKDVYQTKVEVVFEHVFEKYPDFGSNPYAQTG